MATRRPALLLAAATVGAILAAAPALAQLPHPRCGGWPPTRGNAGVLIGGAGGPCYGQILGQMRGAVSILNVQVAQPPAHGSFRMLDLRYFQYEPRAGFTGWDQIVLAATFNVNGQVRQRQIVFRATGDQHYLASGGTASRPPPGVVATRGRGNKAAR